MKPAYRFCLGLILLTGISGASSAQAPVTLKVVGESKRFDLLVGGEDSFQHREKILAGQIVVDLFPATLKSSRHELLWEAEQLTGSTVRVSMRGSHYKVIESPLNLEVQVDNIPVAPGPRKPKKLNLVFDHVDIVEAVKVLCAQMGRRLYIGPGVQGLVNVKIRSVSAEGALSMILALADNDYDYKLVGKDIAIVAVRIRCGPSDDYGWLRQTLPLEFASPRKVRDFLVSRYGNQVLVSVESAKNTIFVEANRRNMFQIKSEIRPKWIRANAERIRRSLCQSV